MVPELFDVLIPIYFEDSFEIIYICQVYIFWLYIYILYIYTNTKCKSCGKHLSPNTIDDAEYQHSVKNK